MILALAGSRGFAIGKSGRLRRGFSRSEKSMPAPVSAGDVVPPMLDGLSDRRISRQMRQPALRPSEPTVIIVEHLLVGRHVPASGLRNRSEPLPFSLLPIRRAKVEVRINPRDATASELPNVDKLKLASFSASDGIPASSESPLRLSL